LGRAWDTKGDPEEVLYDVDDQTRDEDWVSVGVDHDAAAFVVESIRR
jgi:Rhodopirellula transposase DDE domain